MELPSDNLMVQAQQSRWREAEKAYESAHDICEMFGVKKDGYCLAWVTFFYPLATVTVSGITY